MTAVQAKQYFISALLSPERCLSFVDRYSSLMLNPASLIRLMNSAGTSIEKCRSAMFGKIDAQQRAGAAAHESFEFAPAPKAVCQ